MNDISDTVEAEKLDSHFQYKDQTDPSRSELSKFRPLKKDEIRQLITRMSTKSSCLDPIPTNLLKQCLDMLLDPISDIVNSSLEQGEFPNCWKSAVVIPLLKKAGLDLVCKSYRPVSNLSFVSKIVEKAGLVQYVDHLESINMYSTQNSAYKKQHSTETLLVKIHSDIMNNMDNQQITLLVLLDLSAAFDTVNLDILSEIFEYRFNIKENVLEWFQSYLTDRDQRILINNKLSDTYKLKVGVPQGSCAGPVAFLGYLSSLYDIIEKHIPHVGGYADDNQLYLEFQPCGREAQDDAVSKMQECISDVRTWMLTHKLKINDSKTEFLIIGTKQQLSKVQIEEIKVGQSCIKPVNSARNLGVIFDSNMSMVPHVNQVCKKGYYQLMRLRQIKKYVGNGAMESLVHSFVTSNIDYCNILLYGCPKTVIGKLQKLHNAAARVVTGTYKFDHITPVLKQLHWLPISSRIEYKIALLTYKCLHGLAPKYLCDLIVKHQPNRTLRSGSLNRLQMPRTNTKTLGPRAFSSASPNVWNSLPETVKNVESLDRFKHLLKTHLFCIAY
jgi:hypothetical protein